MGEARTLKEAGGETDSKFERGSHHQRKRGKWTRYAAYHEDLKKVGKTKRDHK